MQAYDDYFSNKIVKRELSSEEISSSLALLNTPEI